MYVCVIYVAMYMYKYILCYVSVCTYVKLLIATYHCPVVPPTEVNTTPNSTKPITNNDKLTTALLIVLGNSI